MLRITSFLAAAVVTGVLATGQPASARGSGHGGGGHGGGGHGGVSHGGVSHGGVSHGGHGGYGYYGSGIYLGGYLGSPYSRSYYYDPGYVVPSAPSVVVMPGSYEESEPALRTVPSAPSASSETEVRVILPEAGAQVWIDGLKSSGTDAMRVFGFPDEMQGKQYMHKVQVTMSRDGKMVSEEKEVRVTGGQSVIVNFARPAK
jgi:uncharacterized protein (TIGR03000 family)